MILAGDLRTGSKILWEGEPYIVTDYQLVKPGKGGTYMQTKMRNLISGLIHQETFRSDQKFETPDLEYRNMSYMYKAGDLYEFMDQESFETVSLNKNQLEGVLPYLKEQAIYTVLYFNDRPIDVTAPIHMDLVVTDAPPGVKGDTAQGGSKPVTLETGLTLRVPLFIENGDIIKVDTREGKYVERVKK